uniref:Uncharacterized protein n=2 Tax=Acrobeloides nanus TaxID=290746 RepID=A0A914DXT4_9BILA
MSANPVPVFVDGQTRLDSEGKRYYTCCGTIHIRACAKYIAYFYIGLACFELFFGFYYGPRYHIMGTAVLFMTSGLVIYGDHIEKAGPYLPFVVLNGLGIICSFIAGIFTLLFTWQMPASYFMITVAYIDYPVIRKIEYDTRPYYWTMGGLALGSVPFMFCLWRIVFYTYRYMKYVIEPLKRKQARRKMRDQQFFQTVFPMSQVGPMEPPPPYIEQACERRI